MQSGDVDYLAELDAASPEARYQKVADWLRTEPLPFFAQLRKERPVLETPECTLVATFADVRDCLQMPKIFTVDLYKPKMAVTGPSDGYLMAHDDDALHYREKSLMQGLLNRDDLPGVRKMVGETAQRILAAADGSIELVNEYCRMVPVHLVQDYFGLDGVSRADLIRWSYWNQYDAFNNQPFDLRTDEEYQEIADQHAQASKQLAAYIAVLMVRKLVWTKVVGPIRMAVDPVRNLFFRVFGVTPPKPVDDMVVRMLRSRFAREADFPLARVAVNAGGLLIGAIETTSQAVAQVVQFLIDEPARMRMAKDAAREGATAAFDAIVWEALRFVPIRPDIFRRVAQDYTIGGGTRHETLIRAGTIVRLLTQSAMFDPHAYDDPDTFNPNRTFDHNFNFGFGQHECLGRYVGMEMIPEMVRQVVMLGNIASSGPISYRTDRFPDRDGPFPERYRISWSRIH